MTDSTLFYLRSINDVAKPGTSFVNTSLSKLKRLVVVMRSVHLLEGKEFADGGIVFLGQSTEETVKRRDMVFRKVEFNRDAIAI